MWATRLHLVGFSEAIVCHGPVGADRAAHPDGERLDDSIIMLNLLLLSLMFVSISPFVGAVQPNCVLERSAGMVQAHVLTKNVIIQPVLLEASCRECAAFEVVRLVARV